MVGLGALIAYFAYDLPDIDQAIARTRKPGITLISADGETLAAYGDLYGPPAKLSALPPHLVQAILAAEDRRFQSHFGIDPIGLARAVWINLRAGHVAQGGSTITQQVAKNLFLGPERTFKRKAQEVLLTFWLEHRLSKQAILELYLSRIYLGSGTYGVEAAARRFFGVSAKNVSLMQAAVLAGLPKAPSRYSPLRDPQAAVGRALIVLAAMRDAGFIDDAALNRAKSDGLKLAPGVLSGTGRHFSDWALDQIDSFLGTDETADLVVETTLDSHLQRKAEAALKALLDGPGREAAIGDGAIVILDFDGAVRAMVGGKDYAESQFNRAVQALRQPGSAFKPILFLSALEAGVSPDATILDAPVKIGDWSPENFEGRYRGEVTLTQALTYSLNSVAVRLIDRIGPRRVTETAARLGIAASLTRDASLALGTSEVSLLELTAAYAPFARNGQGAWPYAIRRIRDANGRILYQRQGEGPGRLTEAAFANSIKSMLAFVVREGTGKAAQIQGRSVYGKTGTTQNARDALFVGFTNEHLGGVWLGNDDGAPMKNVTGGSYPARLWRDVMP